MPVEDSELFRQLVKRYAELGESEDVVRSDLRRIVEWARADEREACAAVADREARICLRQAAEAERGQRVTRRGARAEALVGDVPVRSSRNVDLHAGRHGLLRRLRASWVFVPGGRGRERRAGRGWSEAAMHRIRRATVAMPKRGTAR